MENGYVEQLVKMKRTPGQMALRIGSIVSGLLITYILMVLVGIIALAGAFVIAYGIYYLFMMTDVEYEYTLVSGELTICTVYGKNKRKESGVYDIKKCEIIAPLNSTAAAGYHKNMQMAAKDFTSGNWDDGVYLMVAGYGAGNMKIYFEPNEEMIECMKQQAPGKMKMY